MMKLKLGTRDSILALWQANFIKDILESKNIEVELKPIKTKGDKILDTPLHKIGGKGLFTKELENALLSGEIDFAVHSLKDVPVEIPSGLSLVAITKREDDSDSLLSFKYKDIASLPQNAKVGTTSLRRTTQLKLMRKDIDSISLRGNVQTRLRKLESGEFDAIILASAALNRLELREKIPFITRLDFIPAMGQGALGIECRSEDSKIKPIDSKIYEVLQSLEDIDTALCCSLERSFIKGLNGGCQVPIGVHVSLHNPSNLLHFKAIMSDLECKKVIKKELSFERKDSLKSIDSIVNYFIENGAKEILEAIAKSLD
ncbi:hydroxymethylbilane synthase [Helicobacter sp. 13S00401-1]|uniref:hydroxymethylbilane synthase n=1 Tax=Helicobacter sp. 13S00401-1 TaxID=1905758 RepID=UPI000BA6ACC2|nr:hydroxymethylbilane synthase [Helicobacter sp. 13S00401-1]PAF50070.1 hydroxymethylbilane synthase [Helicobacter sp. 13S00401-1]